MTTLVGTGVSAALCGTEPSARSQTGRHRKAAPPSGPDKPSTTAVVRVVWLFAPPRAGHDVVSPGPFGPWFATMYLFLSAPQRTGTAGSQIALQGPFFGLAGSTSARRRAGRRWRARGGGTGWSGAPLPPAAKLVGSQKG